MNAFKYIIKSIDEGKSIKELLLSFHCGKDKIKNFQDVFINEDKVDLDYVLSKGETLYIKINENIDKKPIIRDLNVVYEDDYLLIVNKEKNLLIHSDEQEINLVNFVAGYYKQHHIRRNIRFANRLDYETSGLVIFCKDSITEAYIDYMIRERFLIKKYYLACFNKFNNKEGVINQPIGRDRHNSKKMIIYKKGKEAITKYKVLKNGKISIVSADLITGRTHQLRVHFSFLNHPLVGDSLYGDDSSPLALQAYYLEFKHPYNDKLIKVEIDMCQNIKKHL